MTVTFYKYDYTLLNTAFKYVCVYVCHVCIYVKYMYICIHIHIYPLLHLYTYIYIQSNDIMSEHN